MEDQEFKFDRSVRIETHVRQIKECFLRLEDILIDTNNKIEESMKRTNKLLFAILCMQVLLLVLLMGCDRKQPQEPAEFIVTAQELLDEYVIDKSHVKLLRANTEANPENIDLLRVHGAGAATPTRIRLPWGDDWEIRAFIRRFNIGDSSHLAENPKIVRGEWSYEITSDFLKNIEIGGSGNLLYVNDLEVRDASGAVHDNNFDIFWLRIIPR